jgi:hypothetical protein
MNTIDKVFNVQGEKIGSLAFGEEGLMLSSKSFKTREEFDTAWSKKLTIATKKQIKYDTIQSVTQEESEASVNVRHKMKLGIPGSSIFAFQQEGDNAGFYEILEKNYYFKRSEERLSPLKSAASYIFGLVFTVGITILAHYQAVALASGTSLTDGASSSSQRKMRLFNSIIEAIGDTGVIAIGTLISGYLCYKIWKRYTNPPVQLKLVPPGEG